MEFSFPYKTLTLNEEQSNAVLRDPTVHQRILASAGSGKTTTLTARIAWLITQYKVKPESIVLMTFSRNAAQQMLHRIQALIGPSQVWAGTFHGLARTLLRLYTPEKLNGLYFVDELVGMGTKWLTTKQGREWVGKLRYIVVDEFQDINANQWTMVERMLHPGAKLLVVGDDAQNIYTWRGSDVKFILDLDKKVPGLVDDQLRMNYRSTECIIAAANASMKLIPTLPWKKSMVGPGRFLGQKPDVRFFWHMKDETRWILSTIKDIQRHHPTLSIAILSRTNIDLFRIEEELLSETISYRLRDCGKQDEEMGESLHAPSTVDLVTLHASKGLEWDIVFVIHCNDDVFPSSKRKEDIICERRLFYVAITRAKKHLFLSYTKSERDLSRFIREIPSKLLQYHGLARYCLSEAELHEGVPLLESLLGRLDANDFQALRSEGVLTWLNTRDMKEEYLFPPGEVWGVPLWAKKADIAKDFLRFLRTFLKRLVVRKQSDSVYRDPVAERLLFTLRIFSEDKEFWETWRDELLRLIFEKFHSSEAARVPPPIDYKTISDWAETSGIQWTPQQILAATSLVAKVRGQLRPLRFDEYDLNEFTIAPARFVVPTELRGEILRSWRAISDFSKPNLACLQDIWKISTLQMVAEGRNAPLYRVSKLKESFDDPEFLEFLETVETYVDAWISSAAFCEVGLEVALDCAQPETVDIVSDGVFWRIASEEKERYNSLRLLSLAIVAAYAQRQDIAVHSIGMIYPLEGRCIRFPLPVGWPILAEKLLARAQSLS
jgi:hypothetical protein